MATHSLRSIGVIIASIFVILCSISARATEGGSSKYPWDENTALANLPVRAAFDKEVTKCFVGYWDKKSNTYYKWKGILVRDLPTGELSARVGKINLSKAPEVKVVEIDPPVRYARVTQTQYFIGYVADRTFVRWKDVVLAEPGTLKEAVPKKALEEKGVVLELKDFADLIETEPPEHMMAKRNLWSYQAEIKE